jgi:hypothetical protein
MKFFTKIKDFLEKHKPMSMIDAFDLEQNAIDKIMVDCTPEERKAYKLERAHVLLEKIQQAKRNFPF